MGYRYYEAAVGPVEESAGRAPSHEGTASTVALLGFELNERFGLELRGYLRIPTIDGYTFMLTSAAFSGSEIAS